MNRVFTDADVDRMQAHLINCQDEEAHRLALAAIAVVSEAVKPHPSVDAALRCWTQFMITSRTMLGMIDALKAANQLLAGIGLKAVQFGMENGDVNVGVDESDPMAQLLTRPADPVLNREHAQ